ncbi:MAG: ABC transporter substrate-binding protein, partial [Salinigranum sp.]
QDVQEITGGNDTVGSGFFRDPNVRRAFAYAVPYDQFIKQAFSGHMVRMTCYHFPKMLGYDPSAPKFQHNPSKAEDLFKQAGVWQDGFRLTTYNQRVAGFRVLNLMMKDALESLNDRISINVVQEPASVATERFTRDPPGMPLSYRGYLPQGPDPDAYYRPIMHPDGAIAGRTKAVQYIDDRIPKFIDEGAQAGSTQGRESAYHRLQRLCFQDPAVIPIGTEEKMLAHLDCEEPGFNPAWSGRHFKYYDISNCHIT